MDTPGQLSKLRQRCWHSSRVASGSERTPKSRHVESTVPGQKSRPIVCPLGKNPTHTPPRQTSVVVSTMLSSQTVALAAEGLVQTPAIHTPATWHWSLARQTTPAQGSIPRQVPASQVSLTVTARPSSQVFPVTGVSKHVFCTQEDSWHGSLERQLRRAHWSGLR